MTSSSDKRTRGVRTPWLRARANRRYIRLYRTWPPRAWCRWKRVKNDCFFVARRTRSFVRVCIVTVSVISSISTTWEAIIMALVTVQRSPSVSNSPQSSVSFCSLCVFTGTCRRFLSRVYRLKRFYTIARTAVPGTRCALFNVVRGEPFLIWWCIDSRTWKGNERDGPLPFPFTRLYLQWQ